MKIKGYFERTINYEPKYEPDRDDYPKEDIFYYECNKCKSRKIVNLMHSDYTKYCFDCLSLDIWCKKLK